MKTRKKPLNSTKASSKSPPIIKEVGHASASDSASELNYPKTSEDDEDVVGVGVGGHPLNFRSLQLDHRSNSKGQLSPTNSNNAAVESAKKCINCGTNNSGNGSSSPSSAASTTSTGKVSRHADMQGKLACKKLIWKKGVNLLKGPNHLPT